MFETSWSIKLSQQPNLITIANLPQPSFIYQGNSKHLLVHSNSQSNSLPIRKDLLALNYIQEENISYILLLTRYELSCLDLLNNNELFNLEFENAEKLYVDQQHIYVICGSDLHCYSYQGQQISVNHLSCNIDCLLSVNQTVVLALNDMTMLQYKGVNIVHDYGKVFGNICCMQWMGGGVFVGSEEGTVGYYQTKRSKWKAKSTHKPVKILHYLIDNKQSVAIVGRQNGTIELRQWQTGTTINKVKLGDYLIDIIFYDYRKQGYEQMICVTKSGQIKAFNINEVSVKKQKNQLVHEIKQKEDNIEALISQKANLQYEFKQLQQLYSNKQVETEGPIVSNQFVLTAVLLYNNGLRLQVIIANGYISGLSFQQPILPLQCEKLTKLDYVFSPENTVAGQINCQALVHSNFSSKLFQIRKFNIILPKFWKWGLDPIVKKTIVGNVKFKMNERNPRYLKWMHECFFMSLSQSDFNKMQASTIMRSRFYNHYENAQMQLIFFGKEGRVQIWCDSLKTMGEIVQDLVNYIGAKDLDSQLTLASQKQTLKQTLNTIQKLSQTKVNISAEMAQAINNIKFLLVKGQSARQVGAVKELRKSYGQVMQQNRNLITEVTKKNQNTKLLGDALKTLGQLINQTSNVRYGQSKTKIVNQCRSAIQNKDFVKIITIMERGATNS